MLNILQRICESNKLVAHNFDSEIEAVQSIIAVPSADSDRQEYYFILECGTVDDTFIDRLLGEHIEKFMDSLEKLEVTDESFIKNCTMILCCQAGHISNQKLLRFEENPYFFKKNTITYSNNELIALKGVLDNQFNNEQLNQLLISNEGSLFESFKTLSLEVDSYYPLLIKIMTKLPFVHYIPQPNQLENLDSFVKSELDTSNLRLLDFICDSGGELTNELMDIKISSAWGEL